MNMQALMREIICLDEQIESDIGAIEIFERCGVSHCNPTDYEARINRNLIRQRELKVALAEQMIETFTGHCLSKSTEGEIINCDSSEFYGGCNHRNRCKYKQHSVCVCEDDDWEGIGSDDGGVTYFHCGSDDCQNCRFYNEEN